MNFPEDGDPYVYISNAGWPPDTQAILFEPPINYDQELYEEAVRNNWIEASS